MKVIPRSNVRSAVNPTDANLRLDPTGGESNPKPICFVKDHRDLDESSPVGFMPMQGFDPADLIGHTYLTPENNHGEQFCARVKRKIRDTSEAEVQDRVKFLISVDNDTVDEIATYSELTDYLTGAMAKDAPDLEDGHFSFRRIVAHQGPLEHTDKRYNGSRYNV